MRLSRNTAGSGTTLVFDARMSKDIPASFSAVDYRKRNYALLILTLVLSLFGLVMIYSASSYAAEKSIGDSFYYVKKQAIALFVGICSMVFLSRVDPFKIKKLRYVILAVSFGLLGIIFIPGVGVVSYGARRWIDLGFMTMQPSEVAKFGYVIYAASFLSERNLCKFKNVFLLLLPGVIMCVLIMLEPNMSITMCVLAVMLFMLIVGGIGLKKLLILAVELE